MNVTTPIRVIEKTFIPETAEKIKENFFAPIKRMKLKRLEDLTRKGQKLKL